MKTKELGKKKSLRILSDKKYMEKLRKRMMGNTYNRDFLEKNPIWKKPNWDDHTPHVSVPILVPIINQPISNLSATHYYTRGIIPKGVCLYLK